MKKFTVLVLIATTISYGSGSEEKERYEQTPLVKALKSVDTKHLVAGFFSIASIGNLFKSRPVFAVPICIVASWQAFISKTPNTPQLQDTAHNVWSIGTLWLNKLYHNIDQYKIRLQKEETALQKQQPVSAPAATEKKPD